jgi:thioredoxin 1
MITEPIHVTDGNFEKTVIQSTLPVIVDFWAPWCNPCKAIAPFLEGIAKDYAGKLLVAKVNTDEDSDWALKYKVQGIPNLLFIYNGKVIHQQVGSLPEPMLREVVDQFLQTISQK